MTIIRIQIDEPRDRIGITIGKCRGSTQREAILAQSVAEIAKASINEALAQAKERGKKEKEKQNAESK